MAHTAPVNSNGMFNDPRVIGARKTFEQHSGKAPADPYSYDIWQMASLHAVIFNSLEAVYQNCVRIAPNDLANFLPVARDAFDFLKHHHDLEESLYFPAFEKYYSMDTNRVQHRDFVPTAAEASVYLDKVDPQTTKTPEPFDPHVLREIIDRILVPAAVHMVDELDTLSPERLREHSGALQDAQHARKVVMDHIKKHDDLVLAVPRMVYNRLPGCNLPDEVPGAVLAVLGPICSYMHWGRRKYLWAMKRWETVPVNEEWREPIKT